MEETLRSFLLIQSDCHNSGPIVDYEAGVKMLNIRKAALAFPME